MSTKQFGGRYCADVELRMSISITHTGHHHIMKVSRTTTTGWSTKPANVWLSSLAATIAEVAVYENCRIMFVLLRANFNIQSDVFWCYGTFLADLTTVQYSSVNKDCLIAHHGWEFALFRMYFVYVAYVAGIGPIQFFWPNCFTLSQYVQFRTAHSHSHY